MADIGPYLLVLATALVSGAGGYLSGSLRTRAAGRTAARLVHAELLQNSASVIYYRNTDRLLVPSVRRTAWDANSEALARLPQAGAFTAVSESYQALEGISYVAQASGDGVPADLTALLERAIGRLVTGLEVCGHAAGLDDDAVEAEVRALAPTDTTGDAAAHWRQTPLAILAISAIMEDRSRTVAAPAPAPSGGVDRPERARHAWPDRSLRGRPKRLILDALHSTSLTGLAVVRREGEPDCGDPAADEAYDALGVSYDFFYGVLGLDSYDGKGAELRGVVHYGTNYQNVFWNGQQLVYGDGDDEIFRRFTYALDATARDVMLAAMQHIRPLEFRGQPGALLTSIADVFGVLVKQFRREESVERADWLLGAEMFHPRPGIRGLRSLAEPGTAFDDDLLGKDRQPAHMRDFVRLPNTPENDNGGVHVNCGIPNRAFYLAAAAIGGYAWEGAGRIWFQAVRDPKLTERSGFQSFAGATVRAAGEHEEEVRAAWHEVGVSVRSAAR
ncbi:MAG: M4 family metallopeptidase [Blastococcus sp.]